MESEQRYCEPVDSRILQMWWWGTFWRGIREAGRGASSQQQQQHHQQQHHHQHQHPPEQGKQQLWRQLVHPHVGPLAQHQHACASGGWRSMGGSEYREGMGGSKLPS